MSRIVKNPCRGENAHPWRAEFTQGSGHNRTRISQVFDNKHEAQEWLAKMVTNHSNSLYFNRNMLLSSYLELWLKLFKSDVAPATRATYTATIEHVKRYLPSATLANLNRAVIQGYFTALGRNHATETLRKDLVHLRSSLADAVEEGVIAKNPTQRIKLVGNAKHTRPEERKFMTKVQYKAVRDELMKRKINCMGQAPLVVLMVICQTGLRVGEALALRENDIDVKKRLLHVDESADTLNQELRPPKTPHAVRDVPMTSWLVTALVSWKGKHDDWLAQAGTANPKKLLFLMKNGRLPRATGINYCYHRLQKELGFKVLFSTHTLRHFLVSQMIQDPNITLTYVSRFLGHSSETITQRYYLGLIPDEIDSQQNQVANVIADI